MDTGSLADFMSTSLADQLRVKKVALEKPLTIQLAVQGSRSKVNYGASVSFAYQQISKTCFFDIINLQNYDMILGTPFLFQHQAMVGLNPPRMVIGSDRALPIKGEQVSVLESHMAEAYEENLERAHEELRRLAKLLCAKASETGLPPLWAINHTIPLIDLEKVYKWWPSRCPEPLRPQWGEKRKAYLATGRWRMTSAGNTVPMLFIRKPGSDQLRTVIDLRERNANTKKLSSPLPDIDGILRHVARKRYRSIIDGQDVYEQIRIVPEHVERSAVTTPDGNMVSEVLHQGDCNAPATYQALMNYLFGEYIGNWLDVYLDDLIIYSDSLEEHMQHVKTVLGILEHKKLYLSEGKLQFLCKELKVLG